MDRVFLGNVGFNLRSTRRAARRVGRKQPELWRSPFGAIYSAERVARGIMPHGQTLGVAAAIWVVVAALLVPDPAEADTLVVHPGDSIQAAIDHAPAGSTIVVDPGVYTESGDSSHAV